MVVSLPLPRTVQIKNTKLVVLYGLSVVAVLVYCVQAFIRQMQYTQQVPNNPRLTVSLPESDDHTKVAIDMDSHPMCTSSYTQGFDDLSGHKYHRTESCVGMCLYGIIKETLENCMITSDLHVLDGANSIWTRVKNEFEGIFKQNEPATGGTCADPDPRTPGETDYQCPHPHRKKLTDVSDASCQNSVECNNNCCDLPYGMCDETVYADSPGRYHGCQSQTKNGWNCQAWTTASGGLDRLDPITGVSDHSYCRNADKSDLLWCYSNADNGRGTAADAPSWEECVPIQEIGNPTCGGNAGGAPCKFPFTYKYKEYNSCVVEDEDEEDYEEEEEDVELVDNDYCLQQASAWDDSYNCVDSTEWCSSYAKDMQRCCPVSCGRTKHLNETECKQLTSDGECVYPPPMQEREYCVDEYDLGIVEKPWEGFKSCADEAAKCHQHPDTLMQHCKKTCGACQVSYRRINAQNQKRCDVGAQINSWAECQEAADQLGLRVDDEYGIGTWPHTPPGCWYWPAEAKADQLSGFELGFRELDYESENNGNQDNLCREFPILGDGTTKADCRNIRADAYMSTTGCGWTSQYNCPGQPAGSEGQAENDGSLAYNCCCLERLWEACSESAKKGYCPHGYICREGVCDEVTCADYDCPEGLTQKREAKPSVLNKDNCCMEAECSSFQERSKCPTSRCLWLCPDQATWCHCTKVPDEPWCFTTNFSKVGHCNCKGMEQTLQETDKPVAVSRPSDSWEIMRRSEILAFMDAQNYSFHYTLELPAAEVPFFFGLNAAYLSKTFTHKECITFLVDSHGLPMKIFQPGDEIKISAPVLLHAANNEQGPQGMHSLPAWVFNSGVSIDTIVSCFTDTYDLSKNVNSDYDWDPHIKETIRESGAACVLRVYITDRSSSRITETSVQQGDTKAVTAHGILLRTSGSSSSYHRVYAFQQILLFLTSAIVLMGLPLKAMKFIVLNFLGHLSTVYRQVVQQEFSEEDQCVRSVMQAFIGEGSFEGLADGMDDDGMERVSRDRMMKVLDNSTRYNTDLDPHEKDTVIDFLFRKFSQVKPQTRTSLLVKLSKSLSSLGSKKGREDEAGTVFNIGQFHAVTRHELMPLNVVAKLFDNDRKRPILERMFMPSELKRAIQGQNTGKPSSISKDTTPDDPRRSTSKPQELQRVAVDGEAEEEKINMESMANKVASLEDTVRNLATEVANLTAWKNSAQTIDMAPTSSPRPKDNQTSAPSDSHTPRGEKDRNVEHRISIMSKTTFDTEFSSADLRIGELEKAMGQVVVRLEQMWHCLNSAETLKKPVSHPVLNPVPLQKPASQAGPDGSERQLAKAQRHQFNLDGMVAEQNRVSKMLEARLGYLDQRVGKPSSEHGVSDSSSLLPTPPDTARSRSSLCTVGV